MLRVVVDTNVWVSALLNQAGYPARMLSALRAQEYFLLISAPLLEELAEVLSRPRIARKYGVSRDDTEVLVSLLKERGIEVALTGSIRLCRDPDDDVVLETALVGQADVVVSRDEDIKGDEDLVRLLNESGVEVLSVSRFLSALDVGP